MSLDRETMTDIYRRLCQIREFESALITFATKDAKPIGHPYLGQEAVASGVITALRPDDRVFSTHRTHGHAVAKGCDLERLALELYGSGEGTCRGRAGEMFVAQTDVGYFGGNQIVGGNVAMAAGVALAAQLEQADRVAVTFIGDGGANQGILYEAVNLAAIWHLPVIIVIENNGYAQTTSTSYASAGALVDRGAAFGIASVSIDGQSAVDMYDAAATARQRAVDGGGSTIIEARTYRYEGHYYGDRHRLYRTPAEVNGWLERDPLKLHRQLLQDMGLGKDELDAFSDEAARVSQAAFERAREGAPVTARDLLEDSTVDTYASTVPVAFGGAL